MKNYLVPTTTIRVEQEIKKSKFIAYIIPVEAVEVVQETLTRLRHEYADANHVCWAYIVGEPGNTTYISCSDDGEPVSTAGKPMLNVLQHNDVGDILAVVVRYFGGTKLGTGGLVRAYSSSVTAALQSTPLEEKVAKISFTLILPYALEDVCRRMLEKHEATINQALYENELCLECSCPQERIAALTTRLADAGRGQIRLSEPPYAA